MDKDVFNSQLRRFLKKVGIRSHSEIETAVTTAISSGLLRGNERLNPQIILRVPELELMIEIEGEISLSQ